MSLDAPLFYLIPEQTARLAKAAFPNGNLFMRIRDELGPLYHNQDFADLFASRGRPAEAPARLALVSVMQFVENLSDEQAADAVRDRLAWKYALALELDDPGFDASVLCEFRKRILEGGAEEMFLTSLLSLLSERGLVKARGRQRTDSTHVLASIRTLNRLMLVGETMRFALNQLAQVVPDWLRSLSPEVWFERYSRRVEEYRLPTSKQDRNTLAASIGADGFALLSAVYASSAPPAARAVPAIDILRQVWIQQYYAPAEDGSTCWREADDCASAAQLIHSPYDLEARYSTKKELHWVGYKTHVTETCDDELPHLITHVETTVATSPDTTVLSDIHSALAAKRLLPREHLLDGGYPSAEHLVSSKSEHGIDVVAPVREDPHWQGRAQSGFGVDCFLVDWQAQIARCPQGQRSIKWSETHASDGRAIVNIRFPAPACRQCEQRAGCTRSATGPRELSVRPQAQHEALQAARARQKTEAFALLYRLRAGVEGTVSQGVRGFELRQARYRGLAKVRLQQILMAVAINLVRLFAWFSETPRAETRISPFAALADKPIVPALRC
jgi:transposase